MSRAALVGLTVLGGVLAFAACGGGDDDSNGDSPSATAATGQAQRPPSTGGQSGGPEPVLEVPAVKYVPSEEDMHDGSKNVSPDSYGLTVELYSQPGIGPFADPTEGQRLATEWGYVDGYYQQYEPDGRIAGVLEGRFYTFIEVYLFQTPEGAQKAYEKYVQTYSQIRGSEAQQAKQLGNASSGYRVIEGKVSPTQVDAAYHQFVFRRGNMIGTVQTRGAAPLMTIDPARDIAVMIDERALGTRPAPLPTPSGGTTLPTIPAVTPTP